MTSKKAVIYMIITALLWSTGGLLIKLVDLNSMAISGIRSGIAAITLLPFVNLTKKTLNVQGLLGAVFYALTLLCFVTANKMTTSANAIFLQYTAPIWIILYTRFILKEKLLKSDTLSVIIIFIGMGLFFLDNLDSGKLAGNIIALMSGVSFAGMLIFMKHKENESPINTVFIGNIIAFIISSPFYFQRVPSSKSILGLILLGVFQIGIAYLFYAKSVKYLSTIEAILIPVIEPLLNPVWVIIFLGELPGLISVIGGFVVIVTLVIRSIYQTKNQNMVPDTVNKL